MKGNLRKSPTLCIDTGCPVADALHHYSKAKLNKLNPDKESPTMKKFLIATAAAIALFAAPAFAGNVQGCETVAVAGSNYSVKADPTCQFSGQNYGNARGLVPVTFDVDAEGDAPRVPGIGMSDVPGAGIAILQ